MPEYAWFSNNHSNQIVPLYSYGANSEGVLVLADQIDAVFNAQGQATAGSGINYTDQSELGEYLLNEVVVGTDWSALATQVEANYARTQQYFIDA